MKYLKQFGIIIVISLMGELLNELLPFSVPGSIYGLVLMLLALITGVVKVSQVKETSSFLLDIMPILFIPSTVGLMDYFGVLSEIIVPVLLVCIVGTALVMGITGVVTQKIILAGGMKTAGYTDNSGTVASKSTEFMDSIENHCCSDRDNMVKEDTENE